MRSLLPAIIAFSLALAHPSSAQDSTVTAVAPRAIAQVQRGDKVRVTLLSGRRHVGHFETSNAQWVTLLTSPGQRVRTVERRLVVRVERWIAPASAVIMAADGAGRGMAKGLGIGALIGAVIGAVAHDDDAFLSPSSRAGSAAFFALVFGLVGAAIGTVGGSTTANDASWEILPDSVARSILPTPPPT